MQNHLKSLENESIFIIREAYAHFKRPAFLWSLGKDSTVVMWLIKKAFLGKVPFPVYHIDTQKKFKEMYDFRDQYAREWGIDLRTPFCPPLETITDTLPPAARSAARKTEGLKAVLKQDKPDCLFVGIRRDEESIRAKERYFSPRSNTGQWDVKNQPVEIVEGLSFPSQEADVHWRVHPILNWTELNIWEYTKAENIPTVSLYYAKNGKRYRSLGDQDITHPISSNARTIDEIIAELKITKTAERSGRAMDHEGEDVFERLRQDGYL